MTITIVNSMTPFNFYFDEMMPRAAADQLIQRGLAVTMANDVGMTEKTDPEHLAHAPANHQILVTFDRAFAGVTAQSSDHTGLICLSGTQENIGGIVRAIIAFTQIHSPEEAIGQVFWLKST